VSDCFINDCIILLDSTQSYVTDSLTSELGLMSGVIYKLKLFLFLCVSVCALSKPCKLRSKEQ
jgi:hypothetical protein